MTPTDLHNEIFNHLIARELRFKPRVMTSDRLRAGYWFIGNDDYLNLSFWDGYDPHRNIHRIGFAYDFNGENEVYINFSSRDNESEAILLNDLASKLGAQTTYPNYCRKTLGKKVTNTPEVIRLLDEFIDQDKPIIDQYIPRFDTISYISQEKFNRNISRINNARLALGYSEVPNKSPIQPRKRKNVRGGVTNKSIQTHLRKRLAELIIVQSRHNELQNQLYDQLKLANSNARIIMEENYIDLIQEYEGITHLYEVKPYDSPTRCLREGLGQLLHYCSQHYSDTSNIHLVVAGPSEPNDNDLEYIRFVKGQLRLSFKYLPIV